ncbi:hypothetical protein D3C83_165640 [compost metagenome]
MKWIVSSMHLAFGDQHHFTGPEDAILLTDPLLCAAGEDIDDLLAGRVCMKRMRPAGLHIGPDHH